MKRIQAVIRPEKLEPLRVHLEEIGYPGMMVSEIEGHGKQKGVEHQWRGAHYKMPYLPKVKVEIICNNDQYKNLVEAILEVCSSGNVGDGKIFISEVTDVIRIRTRESGESALG
jgi:nitrogen regulatory protein P-II 1